MPPIGSQACPRCGSQNLDRGDPYEKHGHIEQPMHCLACGYDWIAKY